MRATGEMRGTILQQARLLFEEQGYTATSIKQIARAAGCATSALYYYFEEGKTQILSEVIQAYTGDALHLFQGCADATSLPDLLQRFGHIILSAMPELVTNTSWLQVEFPRLREEEKQHIHALYATLHRFLVTQIARFVASEAQAAQLGWALVCTYIGYEQLFVKLEMDQECDVHPEIFSAFVTKTLAQGMQGPVEPS